jgi:hypothetical protein
LNGDTKISQKPLFLDTFGGFLKFEGGKGTPDHKFGKFYLLNILPPQQSRQLCLEESQFFFVWEIASFAKNSKSGENVKRAKLTIPYLYRI